MNWYRVTRADGSYSWVQANDKSEASRLVRDPGEAIKLVKQVDESEVPASAKGGTPTPTPTTPTPTPTTPTPTTTTPTTTAPTGEYKDWSYLANFGERLEQQIEAYNTANKTSFKFDEAGIKAYLDKIGANDKTKTSILNSLGQYQEAQASYESYLDYYPTVGAPKPKDFPDYLAHFEEWMASWGPEAIATKEGLEATERTREYDAWWRYARKYGETGDWYPVNEDDFFNNYDTAQALLTKWQGMAEETEVEYTDEQQQEWAFIKDYMGYREAGEEYPLDIEDYFANPDKWQQSLATWQQRAGEAEAEGLEEEEYTQWSREQTKYAAQERYGEAPMYPETFTAWLNQQGQFSGALEKYVESQYPSLRSQFEAQAGRLTGFPTREEARAEATRREAGFQSWLGGEVPGLKQEYWAQRPAERGERPYMQSPNVREYNW